MRLEADLAITIDGRPASLRGSGRRLRFEVDEAAVLRRLVADFGRPSTDVGALLARRGLTLEVADRKGLLLVIGAEAKAGALSRFTGSRYIQPASYRAVIRLMKG